jgi:hypothetical protein
MRIVVVILMGLIGLSPAVAYTFSVFQRAVLQRIK